MYVCMYMYVYMDSKNKDQSPLRSMASCPNNRMFKESEKLIQMQF